MTMKRLSDDTILERAGMMPDAHWCDAWPGRCRGNWNQWTGDQRRAHRKSCCSTCITLGEEAETIREIRRMEKRGAKRFGKAPRE